MARFGDYLLVRRLGEGSHGRSFLAEPPLRLGVSDEYVVLKVLHREVSDDDFARASDRLATVASVLSPYLARPLDVVRVERAIGVVTELVPGGALDTPARPIARREVMQAVADAALGAHALHEAGIAHANITPANILLGRDVRSSRTRHFSLSSIPAVRQRACGLATRLISPIPRCFWGPRRHAPPTCGHSARRFTDC